MKVKYVFVLLLFLAVGCQPGSEESNPPVEMHQASVEKLPDDFIIGGKTVSESDDVKFTTVALYNSRLGALCSASIIADDILVTAAHCVSGRPEDLKLGFNLKLSLSNLKPIHNYAVHPKWNENSNAEKNTSDIALIRFLGGLPSGYKIATLLPANYRHKNEETAKLAGYGITKENSSTGAGQLRMVDVSVKDAQFSETEILLDQTQGKGACHGDSGGPAFTKDPSGKLLLWGITSRGYGPPNKDCSGYSIYTKISSHGKWVKDSIEKLRKL